MIAAGSELREAEACANARAAWADWLSGSDAAWNGDHETHVQGCAGCLAWARSQLAVDRLLHERGWRERAGATPVPASRPPHGSARARPLPTRTRRRRPARRRPLLVLAAAAAVVAMAAWLAATATAPPAPEPPAQVLRPSPAPAATQGRVPPPIVTAIVWQAAGIGVAPGTTVAAAERAVLLTSRDGLRQVAIAPGAAVRVAPAGAPADLEHLDGVLTVAVESGRGARLVIAGPQIEVAVLGTRYRLAHAAGATALDVERGAVEARDRTGRMAKVAAGERLDAATMRAEPDSLRRGLLALWRFDAPAGATVAADAGALAGGLMPGAALVAGRSGGALRPGPQGGLRIPLPADWRGAAEGSVAAWVLVTGDPGARLYHGILTAMDGSGGVSEFGIGVGRVIDLWSLVGSRPGTGHWRGISALAADRWHHVAAGYGNGSQWVAVDGRRETPVAGPYDQGGGLPLLRTATATGGLLVGCTSPGDEVFDGLIDDLRIYDRRLDDGELRRLAGSP